MPYDLSKLLVIGISSRALFDLSVEDAIFDEQGLAAYEKYQLENEKKVLQPGVGFPLISGLLKLNDRIPGERFTEVVVMSRNSAETSLRIFNSIRHYNLDVTRAALTGGAPLAPYLSAFSIRLFLSADETDVQSAINSGFAAATVYPAPPLSTCDESQIRIAFDGDAVLFSHHSEEIYQRDGLKAFTDHEEKNATTPLPDGPFAPFLRLISELQTRFPDDPKPIRTALVTARSGPAHERVIRTLSSWNVNIDEAFFLGGAGKTPILKAFRPHMFFDDQPAHCEPAGKVVATSRVPWKKST
jgi:5'-nucleotidase